MVAFLESFVNVFKTIANFISSFVSHIVQFFEMCASGVSALVEVVGFLPSLFAGLLGAIIIIYVVKIILGRN